MPISSFSAPSAIAKPGVCTSSTRPASPFEGQVIYETDTDKALVWNNSAWVYLSTGTANPVGLEFITGGSHSADPDLDVDGCFTTTYRNYRVVLTNVQVAIGGHAIRLNFRAGGTTNASGNYKYAFRGLRTTGASGDTSLNSSTFTEIGIYIGYPGADLGGATIDITQPQVAGTTFGFCNAVGYEGAYQFRQGGFVHDSSSQFDGFRLTLSSGANLTCVYQVYGYKS